VALRIVSPSFGDRGQDLVSRPVRAARGDHRTVRGRRAKVRRTTTAPTRATGVPVGPTRHSASNCSRARPAATAAASAGIVPLRQAAREGGRTLDRRESHRRWDARSRLFSLTRTLNRRAIPPVLYQVFLLLFRGRVRGQTMPRVAVDCRHTSQLGNTCSPSSHAEDNDDKRLERERPGQGKRAQMEMELLHCHASLNAVSSPQQSPRRSRRRDCCPHSRRRRYAAIKSFQQL
jgi:hypothetical protein